MRGSREPKADEERGERTPRAGLLRQHKKKGTRPFKENNHLHLNERSSMKHFSPLLSHWHGQVKQFFTLLHGHQAKVLAMFVLGAMRAESIVVQRVAEELLTESAAKVPSIERR